LPDGPRAYLEGPGPEPVHQPGPGQGAAGHDWPLEAGVVPAEQKIFERRDDWWGAKTGWHALPAVKKVIVLPHYEDPKLTQLLSADQVHATHNIQQPADVEVILQRNLNIIVRNPDKSKPWGWLDWFPNCLAFNCMVAPFDDPEVRW